MVPSVCVDVNGDGVQDILLLTFDGHLALYNGKTLKPIWIADFHEMQSYRLICLRCHNYCIVSYHLLWYCFAWSPCKKPVLFQQFQKISVETFQGFEVNADKRNKWPAIKIFVGFWLNCNNLVLYSACKHVKIGSCFIHWAAYLWHFHRCWLLQFSSTRIF